MKYFHKCQMAVSPSSFVKYFSENFSNAYSSRVRFLLSQKHYKMWFCMPFILCKIHNELTCPRWSFSKQNPKMFISRPFLLIILELHLPIPNVFGKQTTVNFLHFVEFISSKNGLEIPKSKFCLSGNILQDSNLDSQSILPDKQDFDC